MAWEKIQEGVKKALMNMNRFKPYKIKSPYTLELTLMNEELVYVGKLYPGAKRTGDWELTYTNDDLLMVIKAMRWMF